MLIPWHSYQWREIKSWKRGKSKKETAKGCRDVQSCRLHKVYSTIQSWLHCLVWFGDTAWEQAFQFTSPDWWSWGEVVDKKKGEGRSGARAGKWFVDPGWRWNQGLWVNHPFSGKRLWYFYWWTSSYVLKNKSSFTGNILHFSPLKEQGDKKKQWRTLQKDKKKDLHHTQIQQFTMRKGIIVEAAKCCFFLKYFYSSPQGVACPWSTLLWSCYSAVLKQCTFIVRIIVRFTEGLLGLPSNKTLTASSDNVNQQTLNM